MKNVSVIGVVGSIDGVFIDEVPLNSDAESWFLVRCLFSDVTAELFYTKDAKSFIPVKPAYKYIVEGWKWKHEDHIVVKEALERYVTEMAGQNK